MIDVLSDLFSLRGEPGHIRSDNGSESIAKAVRAWIAGLEAKTRLHHAKFAVGERLRRELQRGFATNA